MQFLIPEWHGRLTSTNTVLLERLRGGEGLASGFVLATREQTEGRGRYERKWVSAEGGNLAFSFLMRTRVGVPQVLSLPQAVALGVALLAASRRTKEIGLRKTMGASVTQMAMLISREFAAMVLVATLLALPLVYGAMTLWLRDFVYRVGSVLEFSLLSGVVVLVVVLLPVGIQAVKVARTNPVEALRYE